MPSLILSSKRDLADSTQAIPRRQRQLMTYIIASTNRTGSYLLCEGLDVTEIAGRPTESLSPEYRQTLCQCLYGRQMDFSVSIKAVIRDGMTPNGVFGAKLHWDQLEELSFEAGYNGPLYTFLLEEFPTARYIHLSRRDTLAQAISLSIARQTKEWWRVGDSANPPEKPTEPIFNAEDILELERDLIRQDKAWDDFFEAEGIIPLRVEYETLTADYRNEVGRVLEFLDLDSALAQRIPEPLLQKQGNGLNALWHEWLSQEKSRSHSGTAHN